MTYEPSKLELAFIAFGYIGAGIGAVILIAKTIQLAARALVWVCDGAADRRARNRRRDLRLARIDERLDREAVMEAELQLIIAEAHAPSATVIPIDFNFPRRRPPRGDAA